MTTSIAWYLLTGGVLVLVGTIGHLLERIWLSTSTIYLAVGLIIGTGGVGLLSVDLVEHAVFLEHLTEAAVVISLYGAGLKMRLSLNNRLWLGPILLATLSMTVTVAAVAAVGWWGLGLPIGAAVLLGAVLAPTDPVLAGAVQVEGPDDKDELRLLLTGEAGMNDGTAFPFVLLGVGLAVPWAHELGAWGWQWIVVDVLWRVGAALPLGWLSGWGMARLTVAIRRRYGGIVGGDEILALGLIALVYGLALLAQSYAFLAVFAAAVALRRYEMSQSGKDTAEEAIRDAVGEDHDPADLAPGKDPAELAGEQLRVADALERLGEVVLVVLVGVMMSHATISGTIFRWPGVWIFAGVMLLIIRPLAVLTTLWVREVTPHQRWLAAWFGIRGIGTLYYLSHALALGVADADPDVARRLTDLALVTVALSILLHGVSATPLLQWYSRRTSKV